MADDSLPGLTVREAAGVLDLHVQTVRQRLRDGEGTPDALGSKLMGQHGPEWRLCPLLVTLLHGESNGAGTQVSGLTRTDSTEALMVLRRVETLVSRLTDGQRALKASEQERGARAEELLREAGEEIGRLRAQLDAARARIDELQEQVQVEREVSWWRRLTR